MSDFSPGILVQTMTQKEHFEINTFSNTIISLTCKVLANNLTNFDYSDCFDEKTKIQNNTILSWLIKNFGNKNQNSSLDPVNRLLSYLMESSMFSTRKSLLSSRRVAFNLVDALLAMLLIFSSGISKLSSAKRNKIVK